MFHGRMGRVFLERMGRVYHRIFSVNFSYLPGGIPPESQFPQKNTKNTQNKKCIQFSPRYVVSPRALSLELTLLDIWASVSRENGEYFSHERSFTREVTISLTKLACLMNDEHDLYGL